jgi:serine O-acetyltransferase
MARPKLLNIMSSPIPLYRVARWIHVRGLPQVAYLVSIMNYFFTGCQIPPGVRIGQRARIPDFGAGVVINRSTTIGDDVMILPHVVIGQNVRRGQEVVPAEIVIGNGVILGAGAKIIASGRLEIGDGAVVGANAVVLKSVPAGALAVGVPARIIPQTDENRLLASAV